MSKKIQKQQKKASYKALCCVFFLLVILNLNLITAASFDDFKTYDERTKVYTITNFFGLGETIAELELKTPQNYYVGRGYTKVAEIEIRNGAFDYDEIIKGIELYNIKKGMTSINRQVDYKIEVDKVYPNIVSDCSKGIDSCIEKQNGTFIGKEWIDFNQKTLLKDEIIKLGIFTDVQKGDNVEWIINAYGDERLTAWATWTESLNTNLTAVWEFDETTGTNALESVNGIFNGSLVNTPLWATGKINNSLAFVSASTQYVQVEDDDAWNLATDFTMNSWVWKNTTGSMIMFAHNSFDGESWVWYVTSDPVEKPKFISSVDGLGWNSATVTGSTTIGAAWKMATLRKSGTNYTIYIDGYAEASSTNGDTFETSSANLTLGTNGFSGGYWNGRLDEMYFWERALTDAEIVALYNGGSGIQYNPTVPPGNDLAAALSIPVDYYNSSISDVTFNCSGTDTVGVLNLTLIIDSVDNYTITNSTPNQNLSLQTSLSMSDADYNWTCRASDGTGDSDPIEATSRTLTVDTTAPILTIINPTNTTYTTNVTTLNFSYVETNPSACWYSKDSGATNSSPNDCSTNFTILGEEGSTTLNLYMNDTVNHEDSEAVTFFQDNIYPVITITQPPNYSNYTNGLVQVNYTITETNKDSCWYSVNRGVTNTSIVCANNNISGVTFSKGGTTLFIYANDSANNVNSTSVFFTVKNFIEDTNTFNAATIEGSQETFTLNFTYDSTEFTNLEGLLVYNNTNHTGTITKSGDYGSVTATIQVPSITTDTTFNFNWSINFINATNNWETSTLQSQYATNLNLGNCTAYSYVLLNLSLKDEATQNFINATLYNTTVEVDITIYPIGSSTKLLEFSTNFSENNNPTVCLEYTLNSSQYTLDSTIRYDGDGYASEFYNIQNYTVINSSLPQLINLFDIKDSESQAFTIRYRDSNFLPIQDALIQIQRKYIDEGIFKTVEIPKTDIDGLTLANLRLNEVIYTFVVVKNGVTLGTFANQLAVCQTPLISECLINLNSLTTQVSTEDYTVLDDFTFTLTYDQDTRKVQTIYTIPSSTSEQVKLNVTLADGIGNTEACSHTITAASGTLFCTVPVGLGNTTVTAKLFKAGTQVGYASISQEQSPSDLYGSSVIFLGLFLIITIVGIGLSDDPKMLGIFLIIGSILLIALNLIDTGVSSFYGYGATGLWIMIAIIIVLIKGSKR